MEWLSRNPGPLIYAAVIVVGFAAGYALVRYRIGKAEEAHKELAALVTKHIGNTALHIDPHRDEKRWDDFRAEIMRGFERMESSVERVEKKVELLMTIHPAPPMPPGIS